MLKPLLATALLFAAVPAIAGDKPAGPIVRVATADLDLASAKGRRALDRRIDAAVDQVCATVDAVPQTGVINPAQSCRTAARAGARHQRDTLIAAIDARRSTGIELASAK